MRPDSKNTSQSQPKSKNQPNSSFVEIQKIKPDNKGRVHLGKLARGISSFGISIDEKGRLLLEPFAEAPAPDIWKTNPELAKNSALRALADLAKRPETS